MMKVRIKKGIGWNHGMESKEFRVLTPEEFNLFCNFKCPTAVYPVEHPDNKRDSVKVVKKQFVEVVEEESVLENFKDANGIIQHPKGTFIRADRKAVVGDKILIVSPCFSHGKYKENDILTVEKTSDYAVFCYEAKTSGNWNGQVDFNEFIVIESYNEGIVGSAWETITKLGVAAGVTGKEILEAFKAISSLYQKEEVELVKEEFVKSKVEKSERDKVVDYARDYVNNLLTQAPFKVEFIVNKDKRIVVCLLRDKSWSSSKVVYRGKAKASEGDCFNIHIGKAIALSKALDIPVPKEFINAPQPQFISNGCIAKINGCDPFVYGEDTFEIWPNDVIEIVDDSARYPE